jgi:large subunit ribosomal protein L30
MRYKITQVRSVIGTRQTHKGTLRALGLGRIGRSTVRGDSEQLRGQLRRVASMVKVEEFAGE